ncbi:MAG: hypothetical protein L0Z73_03275 [Gammaproteobacteria bacterium]|nr:hypothetical protein [Gammaproteobacteria bacterium]
MKPPEREAKVLQVLLALDAASHDINALETAVLLASQLRAELIGLFIEDMDLLRSANLPFAREIVSGSGEERSITSDHIERALRAWASQVQAQLVKEAQKANIKCTFRTVRSRRIETLLSETGVSKLLIISHTRQQLVAPLSKSDVVYLLFDGSPEAHHGVAIVSEMALKGLKHIVLIDACEENVEYSAKKAADWLTRHGVHVLVQKLQEDPNKSLPPLLKKYPAALLLVPAHFPEHHTPDTFAKLQNKLNCPVVIVS